MSKKPALSQVIPWDLNGLGFLPFRQCVTEPEKNGR